MTSPASPASPTGADRALSRHLAFLSPTPAQVERMGARVDARLAAAPRSLVREWLALLRARPAVNVPLALAAAAVLFVSTPLGALTPLLGRLPQARHAATAPGAGSPAARDGAYALVEFTKRPGAAHARDLPLPPRARALRDPPPPPRPPGLRRRG